MEIQFYYKVENKNLVDTSAAQKIYFFCTRTNTSSVKLKNVNVNTKWKNLEQ